MADNAQKNWLPDTLNRFGQKKAWEAIQQLGKALPASIASVLRPGVPVVQVKFELVAAPFTIPNVTCPVFGPQWIRMPLQVGMKGVVFPIDTYLGGVSGIGGGDAQLGVTPGNLSSLVFFPIGNANWEASEAPTSVVIYGPDGVIIRNVAKTISMTLSDTGIVFKGPVIFENVVTMQGNLQLGGSIESVDGGGAPYAGDLKTTGNVIANFGEAGQIGLTTHTHSSSTPGNQTSAPTAGT